MNLLPAHRLHRWLGIGSAAVILLVAVTGLLLHHPRWLGAPSSDPTLIAHAPGDADRMLRVAPGILESSTDGGRSWAESPLDLVPSRPVRLVAAADGLILWLVGQDGLLVSDDGVIWDRRSLPLEATAGSEVVDIAPASADRAVLLATAGAWATSDGGRSWQPLWEAADGGDRWRDLVHRLHTGHWLHLGAMPIVYDIATVALLVLVITGLALWRTGRRARNGAPSSPRR